MIRSRIAETAVGAVLLALMVPATEARADCAGLLKRFNAALRDRNLAEVVSLEKDVAADASCCPRQTEVKRQRILLQLITARKMREDGASAEKFEALLVEAARPEVVWQASEMLGHLRFGQRRYAEATQHFDRALDIIRDVHLTPKLPDRGGIADLFERAAIARLLAGAGVGSDAKPRYVRPPMLRCGNTLGGIFGGQIRGFLPTSLALPILFHTETSKMTAIGAAAAQDLLTVLLQRMPKVVTVVGHADERGSAAHARDLSMARARAVAEFLRQHGVKSRLVTVGKGASEPLAIPPGFELAQEEIWTLNRRVEWRLDGTGHRGGC